MPKMCKYCDIIMDYYAYSNGEYSDGIWQCPQCGYEEPKT